MTTDILHENVTVYPYKNEYPNEGKIKIFGFWIYLMTDCVLFGCLFISYIVLINSTAGGPTGKEIFKLMFALEETTLLLFSSFTYGMSVISMKKNSNIHVIFWMLLTWCFGTGFIGMEIYEIYHFSMRGLGPDRSGFLSAFFALIGTHSFHVIFGLIWMIVLIYQIISCGLANTNRIRIICLSLFWHFLDIIWICVFSVVYLIGVM